MKKDKDNILHFRQKTENVMKQLEKVFNAQETKAYNLNIILSQAIRTNDFYMLYEYLSSEIEFYGGVLKFSEDIKINPSNIRNFFRSAKVPDN